MRQPCSPIQGDSAHFGDLPLPAYATGGAAGMDVVAAVDTDITLHLVPAGAVPTGLSMAVAAGHEVQVRPRSGLALRHGVTVANAPGTIDSDYRGEVKVILINLGDADLSSAAACGSLRSCWRRSPAR